MVINIWPRQFNTALCCVVRAIGKILHLTHFLCFFHYPHSMLQRVHLLPLLTSKHVHGYGRDLRRLWSPAGIYLCSGSGELNTISQSALQKKTGIILIQAVFWILSAKKCRIILFTLESWWPSFHYFYLFIYFCTQWITQWTREKYSTISWAQRSQLLSLWWCSFYSSAVVKKDLIAWSIS